MEGMPQRRRSAAAEGRAADFDFAHETPMLGKQEEAEAVDKKIAALQARKQEGRKFIANTTNEKILEVAEKNEEAIDAEIAQLELQKQELLGQKPN